MDEQVQAGDEPDQYEMLAPFFSLENGWTAPLGRARPIRS